MWLRNLARKAILAIGTWDFKWFLKIIHKNHKYYNLGDEDLAKLRELLHTGYYIVLTRRNSSFCAQFVTYADLILTGHKSHYTHALFSVHPGIANKDEEYWFIESTEKGVHYATFMDIMDCDSVCVLEPKNVTHNEWCKILDDAAKQVGTPYDTFFNLQDNTEESCVEVVRNALRAGVDNYVEKFKDFEATISKYKELTPQMYRNCLDFNIKFEIRR